MATIELSPLTTRSEVFEPYSRYYLHPLYIDENRNKFVGSWNPPVIQSSEDDATYTVEPQYAYRPDLIANSFYENPYLSWVISYVNNISNPLDKIDGYYPGRVITIPSLNSIYLFIS